MNRRKRLQLKMSFNIRNITRNDNCKQVLHLLFTMAHKNEPEYDQDQI